MGRIGRFIVVTTRCVQSVVIGVRRDVVVAGIRSAIGVIRDPVREVATGIGHVQVRGAVLAADGQRMYDGQSRRRRASKTFPEITDGGAITLIPASAGTTRNTDRYGAE